MQGTKPQHLLGPLCDQASVKDQVPTSVMSASQLATPALVQLPTGSDPVLGMCGSVSAPASAATAWLAQDTSMSLLSQGVVMQQQQQQVSAAGASWSISAQGPTPLPSFSDGPGQLQLQALKGGASSLADFNAFAAALPGNCSTAMPASQGVAAAMQALPLGMQQVGQQSFAASDAHQQPQLLMTASGEQLMMISGAQAEALHQQQQLCACVNLGVANPAVSAAAVSGPCSSMQLQEAMQRLSEDNMVVQQVLMGVPVSQKQVQAYCSPVCSIPEGLTAAVSSPAAFDPNTPMLLAPQPLGAGNSYHASQFCSGSLTASSSPGGSCGGMDSLSLSSSSWHTLEGQSNSHSNTSSPSFRLQAKSRLGLPVPSASGTGSAAAGQGVAATLQVLSAPEAPQSGYMSSAAAGGMVYAPAVASYAAPGAGYVVLSGSDNTWQVTPAGCGAAGGTLLPQQQPAMYAVCEPQGTILAGSQASGHAVLGAAYLQLPQPGRLASGFPAGYLQHQQHPGLGFKPYGPGRVAVGVLLRPKSTGKGAAGAGPKGGAGGGGEGATGAPSARSLATGAYSSIKLQEGLSKLWGQAQLQAAKGGRLYNVQQLAWHPADDPAPCAQDMYNFQKLKRLIQKLDAVHKTRVKLIKRIHAVADHGEGDLKSVYREVRTLIGEMLHASAFAQMKSLEECRVTGLVQLALMLQDALEQGPQDAAQDAAGVA